MVEFRSSSFLIQKKPKQVYILLFSGIVIGGLTGIIGSMFQLAIAFVGKFRNYLLNFGAHNEIWQWGLPIVFTLTCLLLSLLLVKRFAPEASGSGLQEIEGALGEKRVIRWQRILPVKFFGGVLSLSAGMVAGREGPTIQMGGAVGEMLSERFMIASEFRHTFIAAGAAAGLSAAFNAPLAGILFVIEEMRPYFKYSFMSMQCIVLASLVSSIVLRIIMGQHPGISIATFISPPLASIWLFVILGCIFGAIGVIFNKYLLKTLDYFTYKNPKTYWMNIVLVGVCVGILTKVYPEVIGDGYLVIPQALNMQLSVITLILVFFARMGTTWTCYGTGIPGGIFAPMLALGTTFGMCFGHCAHVLFPSLVSHPGIFAVAGMSALFTATVGAPLTGIILVAEMTLNYELLLPLILTCFSATIVSYLLGGIPIYESLLIRTLRIAKKMNPPEEKSLKHHSLKD